MDRPTTPNDPIRDGWRPWLGDISGAFADLGIFLPLVIGLLIVGAHDASGILVGFGVFAIATGLYYRRPVPVQPMKAIAALAITGVMTASDMMASGIILGVVLLALGGSGLIVHVERLVPRTILFGIQLGLGLSLIVTSAALAGQELWLGVMLFAVLVALGLTRLREAGCLILLACAIAWPLTSGAAQLPPGSAGWHWPGLHMADLDAYWRAMETGVLPQLALTVTNAVLLTAAIAGDYFPQDRHRINARNLAMSSGGLNLLLAPFGAVPMCHGAGGLAAQYGQGARTGLAPVIFGVSCLALGVLAGPNALAWLELIPMAVIAALLAFAGYQLMNVRRLTFLRPACLTIIGLTALVSLLVNVAVGLLVGCLAELVRAQLGRRYAQLRPGNRS
jgi:MFS superfamily sulfate permease-like transporter